MDKKYLIMMNLLSMALLVLVSIGNVVGNQTIQNSQQNTIKERIDKRGLLLQTICDIANNNEIKSIILKFQMSRGIFSVTEIPNLTNNKLKQMYFIGLALSKIISKSSTQALIQKHQFIDLRILKKIRIVIEKTPTLKREISQLQESECAYCNENISDWKYPIVCNIIILPLMLSGIMSVIAKEICYNIGLNGLGRFFDDYSFIIIILVGSLAYMLGCWFLL